MTVRLLLAVLGLANLAPMLRADTLTLRSNIEINGQVKYADDSFAILAKYKNAQKTYKFDRKDVRSLEINNRDFNSGEPPVSVSIFDSRVGATRDAAKAASAASGNDERRMGKSVYSSNEKSSKSSPLDAENVLPTDDVVWLRNRSKLIGRVKLIEGGHITILLGSRSKQIDEQQALTVLVAQE